METKGKTKVQPGKGRSDRHGTENRPADAAKAPLVEIQDFNDLHTRPFLESQLSVPRSVTGLPRWGGRVCIATCIDYQKVTGWECSAGGSV